MVDNLSYNGESIVFFCNFKIFQEKKFNSEIFWGKEEAVFFNIFRHTISEFGFFEKFFFGYFQNIMTVSTYITGFPEIARLNIFLLFPKNFWESLCCIIFGFQSEFFLCYNFHNSQGKYVKLLLFFLSCYSYQSTRKYFFIWF